MKIKFTLLFLVLILTTYGLEAQYDFARLNALYSKTNLGRDFIISVPPGISANPDNGEYVKIFMTSLQTAVVTVSVPGYGYYPQKITVKPGVPQVIAIPANIAQPMIQDSLTNPSSDKVFINKAIRISADFPIGVYVIVDYADSKEGFLAYPLNVLGNRYTVASSEDPSQIYPGLKLNSNLSVVGISNNTTVKFYLGGKDANSRTAGGLKPGDMASVNLNKGDVWVISSVNSNSDLSGSVVTADKPVSVIAGNRGADVPMLNKLKGYIAEMMVPDYSLGKEYLVPRVVGRKYSSVVRIFAAENNTTVWAEGKQIGKINAVPGLNGSSYLEYRPATNEGNVSYTISADKPISVVMYNAGREEDDPPYPDGSPFEMALAPVSHQQKEIVFTIPRSADNEFKSDYLAITVKTDAAGNIPDSLMLGYYVGNVFTQKIINTVNFQLLTNDVLITSTGGIEYRIVTIKLPQSKGYTLNCDSNFSAAMYGFGTTTAYGFPAALEFGDKGSLDTIPPSVSWTLACNGDITGTAIDMPGDDAIRSNLGTVTYDAAGSDNYTTDFDEIDYGVTRKINWKLKIINSLKDAKAYFSIEDAAGNPANAAIKYIAPKIGIDPAYYDFGAFKKGDTLTHEFTIFNNSDSAYVLSKIMLKDGHQGFEIKGYSGDQIIIPGKSSYSFGIIFTAGASGTFTDSLGFGNDCFSSFFSEIRAVVGSPLISVDDINFYSVTIGDSVTREFSIKNKGSVDLFIKSYTGPNSPSLGFVEKPDISPQNILKLQSGASAAYTVYFKPKTEGSLTDYITFSSDANGTDSIAFINGVGVKPGLVAESFDWKTRRINRTNFPAGPYPVLNDHNSIRITNTGSTVITLKGIEFADSLDLDAFPFNHSLFSNKEIAPGKSLTFPVNFFPSTIGKHQIVIKYIDDKGGNAATTLQGIGVAPKIDCGEFDFDTTLVHNDNSPNIKKITIHNQGYSEWEYADTLNVYDIKSLVDGEISDNLSKFGTKGFKYNRDDLKLPITLAPDSSYSFFVDFSATSENLNSAELNLVSDALDPCAVNFIGYGISRDFTVFGASVETCLKTPGVALTGVKNFSKQAISFDALAFDNPDPDFTINNPDGFTLQPDETKQFNVYFTPSTAKDKSIGLIFRDRNNPEYKKVALIEGKTLVNKAAAALSPDVQTTAILSDAELSYIFRPDFNTAETPVKDMTFSISYNNSLLVPQMDKISIGDDLRGLFEIYDKEISDDGSVIVKIRSIAGSVVHSGELLKFSLKLYFPNDTISNSQIIVKVAGTDNPCVQVDDAFSTVKMEPYCAQNMRLIDFSPTDYAINYVMPNPVTDNKIIINYSIAFDGNTKIELLNSMGSTIRKPLDSEIKAGNYELTIDAAAISSGIYFVRLTSGFYSETTKVIISK